MLIRNLFLVIAAAFFLAACPGSSLNDEGKSSSGASTTTTGPTTPIEEIINPSVCTPEEISLLSQFAEDPSGSVGTIVIRGNVVYGRVNQPDTVTGSLDYATGIDLAVPAYFSSVNAVACDGSIVSVGGTAIDGNGDYLIRVPANINVTLQVTASAFNPITAPDGDIGFAVKVIDNQNSGAVHVLPVSATVTVGSGSTINGELLSTIPAGSESVIADIVIDLGWNNSLSQYTSRDSAPFAISDSTATAMYDIAQSVANTQKTGSGRRGESLDFGTIKIAWNENNAPGVGDFVDRNSAYYNPSNDTIYLLGRQNVNTDEFDADVITALLVERLMYKYGRIDVPQLNYAYDAKLDPRAALYKGFPIGFATAVRGQIYYKDSRGSQATTPNSIVYNLEDAALTEAVNRGWYSPISIAQIVYDLLDANNDGEASNILSYELIDALTEAREGASFVTLFSFISALKRTVFDDNDGKGGGDPAEAIDAAAISEIDNVTTLQGVSNINANDDVLDDSDEISAFKAANGNPPEFNEITWGGNVGLRDFNNANLSGAFGLDQIGMIEGELPVYFHAGLFGEYGQYGIGDPDGDGLTFTSTYGPQKVCSINDYGEGYKLGNVRYVAFTVFDKSAYGSILNPEIDNKPDITITVEYASGIANPKTVIRLIQVGGNYSVLKFINGVISNKIEMAEPLSPGAYLLEISHAGNLGVTGVSGVIPGKVCYNVTIDDYSFRELN